MQLFKPRRLRRRRRRRSPLQLMDDVVDEILLRLPPDDPASLFRASAVCKTWRRIATDPAFAGRYRAFHRTPPLLGVLRDLSGFVPTTSFRPNLDRKSSMIVSDCRHGRVLLNLTGSEYAVWNPITGDQHRLPEIPEFPEFLPDSAAVLCAAGGRCGHSGCAGGPFRVAVVCHGDDNGAAAAHACIYSSITGSWSEPTSIQTYDFVDSTLPVALVSDAFYFPFELSRYILRYDTVGRGLSFIKEPPSRLYGRCNRIILTDGSILGIASFDDEDYRLYLGFGKAGLDGDVEWAAPHRVIDLNGLLPRGVDRMVPVLMGVADGAYAILANDDEDVFIIDIESLKSRKVCNREKSYCVFPYMSFCTPGTG